MQHADSDAGYRLGVRVRARVRVPDRFDRVTIRIQFCICALVYDLLIAVTTYTTNMTWYMIY